MIWVSDLGEGQGYQLGFSVVGDRKQSRLTGTMRELNEMIWRDRDAMEGWTTDSNPGTLERGSGSRRSCPLVETLLSVLGGCSSELKSPRGQLSCRVPHCAGVGGRGGVQTLGLSDGSQGTGFTSSHDHPESRGVSPREKISSCQKRK